MGVLPWGKHRKAPPSECLVRLKGIRLGLSEFFVGPSPLPDAFPGSQPATSVSIGLNPGSHAPRAHRVLRCGHGGILPSCACLPAPLGCRWPRAPRPWGSRRWPGGAICSAAWPSTPSWPRQGRVVGGGADSRPPPGSPVGFGGLCACRGGRCWYPYIAETGRARSPGP